MVGRPTLAGAQLVHHRRVTATPPPSIAATSAPGVSSRATRLATQVASSRSLAATHAAPSVRKTSAPAVPAKRRVDVTGSIARAPTLVPMSPVLKALQLPAPFVERATPPPNVAA